MDKLDPTFTTRVEFDFGALFVPDDPLAQWIANLGRAINDLLLANRRLAADLETGSGGNETIYDIRAVGAHAWEFAKFLGETDEESVDEFLDRLHAKAREDFERAMEALQEPGAGASREEKSFKSMLASARDQASHYSQIDHKLLRGALRRLAKDEERKVNRSSVDFGKTFKDSYNQFGTEVDYQLFCEIEGGDTSRLREFVGPLNELVANLLRFGTTAIHTYLQDHKADLEVTKLD